LTVVIFRYLNDYDNQVNQRLIEAIHADGRVFLSSTRIGGKLWLRCAVVSHRTHLEEINLTLKMIQEKIDKIVS
jgi:aromatic-L-amino-acid/L-tryptophan decarboxylase